MQSTHVTHSTKACTTCNRQRKIEVKAVVGCGDWRVEGPVGGGRGAVEGRKTVKNVIRDFVRCKRYNARSVDSENIPLPANRVTYTNVFEITGIDLAGPLFLRNGEKAWIVLFTCGIYRAVHFELTNSLSTNNVLLRFHRFIARRGRPSVVYIDNVTNLTGTVLEFKNLNWMKMERETEIQRIKWEFIPLTAPWCGRWWERLLRILKDLLKRTLGKAVLTYEELLTVSCDCESIINSRPLINVSEDLDDQVPITPAMFLMTNSYLVVTDLDLRERWTLKLAKIDQNVETLFCYINILLSLLNQTHKIVRSVIRFLSARNLSAADIHWQIFEVYGATAMREGKVRKWARDFKAGRDNVHDESRSGRPSVITDDMVASVEA
ncbi:hypothetical protein AVEN_200566-1 [Araneus ventricosus]|uniref:Integrase catalytic domain-containing protein n=1 Tax=Araneus ventricosus TaxID=182803 RepID=A0A4Y2J0J0_ARAVE|nr:hypothetical protein AVEN_200566-1 [Araneus ventricosus]